MRKRLTAMLLALSLALSMGASAALAEGAAAEESAEPKAPWETDEGGQNESTEAAWTGPLAFADLEGRVRGSYFPLLALEENVRSIEEIDYAHMEDELRDTLNELASVQWMMVTFDLTLTDEYKQVAQAYDAMRKQFDDIREGRLQKDNADLLRQLRNAQNQMIVFGETIFIALKGLEAQDAALTRTIGGVDRSIRELELRCELGQVPALTLDQAKAGRTQAVSGQQTLRMNYDNYLLQLENMTGAPLGGGLQLGALPKVSSAQLAAMNVETDLAQAKNASFELLEAKNTFQDAKDDFDDAAGGGYGTTYQGKLVQHNYAAAKYTYEDRVRSFELNFRTLYAQVKDCAQVLNAARTVLGAQQKSCDAAQLKFSQGNISANALAEEQDKLAESKAAVADAERELFSKYRTYCWAVEYGILNV